jgi:hypothetical protein
VGEFRRKRPDCAAATFHWHAWGDVGMATKPETQLALEMIGMQFMPAAEGFDHLICELESGLPEAEVLITDDQYYRKFYPSEAVASVSPSSGSSRPLVEQQPADDSRALKGRVVLNPTVDPFLIEHRLDDQPLMPVVVGLELLCEGALAAADLRRVSALKNVELLNGVRFRDNQSQELNTVARPTSAGAIACQLQGDFHSRNGRLVEAGRVYMRGLVEVTDRPITLAARPMRMQRGAWKKVEYPTIGSQFYLGPPLRGLRRIRTGQGRAWGQIIAPLPVELAGAHRPADGWILPSAALDACLYATGLLAWWQVAPGVALPMGFGSIVLGRLPTPGEECLVETRFKRHESNQAYFDFTLIGENHDVLVDVTNYRIVWLPESQKNGARPH